jgi:hypothetical protein
MAALAWMPTDASACAIVAEDEDDECAEYVWGYDGNGVRVSGQRVGDAGEITESSTIDVGVDGGVAEAGASGTRTVTYAYASYRLSNGRTVKLDCVNYEIVHFLD